MGKLEHLATFSFSIIIAIKQLTKRILISWEDHPLSLSKWNLHSTYGPHMMPRKNHFNITLYPHHHFYSTLIGHTQVCIKTFLNSSSSYPIFSACLISFTAVMWVFTTANSIVKWTAQIPTMRFLNCAIKFMSIIDNYWNIHRDISEYFHENKL